jgi:hypothetical protein
LGVFWEERNDKELRIVGNVLDEIREPFGVDRLQRIE